MSIPINWLVLFFFIILAVIFLIVFEINSKLKWRARAYELEDEVQKLKNKLSASSNLKLELSEIAKDIKKSLSQRQFQIFMLTIEGLSSKEIANKLKLSARTIDSHIKEILDKFKLEKRTQLFGVFFNKVKTKVGIDYLTEL